jgi:hypothetical protein
MGYTTDFWGELSITPPLTQAQVAYINDFSATRHMVRDVTKLKGVPDPLRRKVGLPLGEQGEYFLGKSPKPPKGKSFFMIPNRHPESIIDGNREPDSQPGLWCQWIVNEEGTELKWDEGEKFYYYVEWLEYLIKHFFGPWGRTLEGQIHWEGEDSNDKGVIWVKDNKVEAVASFIGNPGPSWYRTQVK